MCQGLENPLVSHVKALTEENTPDRVIQTGAVVVEAYRAGCD